MEYWQCDAVCFFLGIYFIITAVAEGKYYEILYSISWIWIYPVPLEICLNLAAIVRKQEKKEVV